MLNLELVELQTTYTYNKDLCDKLKMIKCKIDDTVDWDKMKKLSNPYELIHSSTTNCKNNKSIPCVNPISRSYFKLIEIMKIYSLVSTTSSTNMIAVAEGPGGFIESFICRNKSFEDDRVYGITLPPSTKCIPSWDKLTTLYSTKNLHTSYGNIYNISEINTFVSNIRTKSQFITADGGFDYSNDFNGQETQSCRIILAELIICFKCQAIGGNFVCKFFDLFNILTVKLVYILKKLYTNFYIYKPVTSRPANSERYIICKGFIGISDELLKNLENILEQWEDDKIYDISGITLDNEFNNYIQKHNISFVSNQIKYLDKTLVLTKNNPSKYNYNKIISQQVLNATNWCRMYGLELNRTSKYLTKYNI